MVERKPVRCKWVYKGANFRTRLVAVGFNQKYGLDYAEVFAPVIKQTTLRILLANVSKRKLILKHFGVKMVYLYGILEKELYVYEAVERL